MAQGMQDAGPPGGAPAVPADHAEEIGESGGESWDALVQEAVGPLAAVLPEDRSQLPTERSAGATPGPAEGERGGPRFWEG